MALKREQGFTLLEVLITVAVLAILTALAAPNFRKLMDKNAVTTQANELMSNILLARSEAVKRNQRVVVRRSGGWKDRVIVFADSNNNDTYQSATDGPLIVDHQTPDNTVAIAGHGAAATFIRFNSRGRAVTAGGNSLTPNNDYFTLSKDGQTRYICFTPTGRPRVQETSCP
ncbi:type IV pilus biogenesis protein FimT [Thiolapillus brandeum]|uniref:Type II secretion system protein H n=2 Tax=Thiolapillus brandeum TaxID=1076588 RepID=A0A7U6JIF3_9GAMM|nr:type IV pilus biogenesis protein FimT [Thiolapillus brandeum]